MGEVWGWPSVPLVVVPLDATNAVPVTPDLIYRCVCGWWGGVGVGWRRQIRLLRRL